MKTVGPFDTNELNLSLLALTDSHLYLIRLNLISSFKYHVSLQIPFLFAKKIDKIKSKSLVELKSKYSWAKLELNNDLTIIVTTKNKWKNTITLSGKNINYKLTILERHETVNYISILQNYYGDRIKLIIE